MFVLPLSSHPLVFQPLFGIIMLGFLCLCEAGGRSNPPMDFHMHNISPSPHYCDSFSNRTVQKFQAGVKKALNQGSFHKYRNAFLYILFLNFVKGQYNDIPHTESTFKLWFALSLLHEGGYGRSTRLNVRWSVVHLDPFPWRIAQTGLNEWLTPIQQQTKIIGERFMKIHDWEKQFLPLLLLVVAFFMLIFKMVHILVILIKTILAISIQEQYNFSAILNKESK